MKIVYINQYAGGAEYGMSLRPERLAEIWAGKGHDVSIIGAGFSHLRHTQPQFKGILHEENKHSVRRLWVSTPSYRGNGFRRMVNILFFSTLLVLRLPFSKSLRKADIFIASSTHPFEIFGVKFLAWLNGGKVIFELHDIWPESLIELGSLKPLHPFTWLVKGLRPLSYRWADGVVSMLPQAGDHIAQFFKDSSKVTFIPNGAPSSLLNDASNDTSFDQLTPDNPRSADCDVLQSLSETSKSGRLNCVYTGYLAPQNAMADVLEIADRFIGKIDFHIIGDGPLRHELLARFGDVENVMFHGVVPADIALDCQRAADVLYLGWQKKEIYRYGVTPNKLFEYFAAGKPVIQALSHGENLVERANAGICCPAEDREAMASAFEKISNLSAAERKQMGARGRKFVKEHFSYDSLADKFLDFMLSVQQD